MSPQANSGKISNCTEYGEHVSIIKIFNDSVSSEYLYDWYRSKIIHWGHDGDQNLLMLSVGCNQTQTRTKVRND